MEILFCAAVGPRPHDPLNFLDGQTLPINRRQKAYANGTLIIEQLQRTEDAGTYTCMAQNKQKQTARRNVEIQVLSKFSCLWLYFSLFCFALFRLCLRFGYFSLLSACEHGGGSLRTALARMRHATAYRTPAQSIIN